MVSINIRVSTQEIWRYRKQKLGSSYSQHSFTSRRCLGWLLPDCVLCSHKDRGGGERESPLDPQKWYHTLHTVLQFVFFIQHLRHFPDQHICLYFFFFFFHFFLIYFLIGGQLLYNVVLVSAEQ